MSKHTPGPWQFIGDGLFGGCYSDKLGDHVKYQIHPFYDEDRTQGMHGQRHEADKRLIEAAPCLLDALDNLRHEAQGYLADLSRHKVDAVTLVGAIKRANAAIAKATQES